MRKVIVVAVLVLVAVGVVGCGPKDAHQLHTERNINLSWQADARSLVDDVQWNVTYDARPSHTSFFNQE